MQRTAGSDSFAAIQQSFQGEDELLLGIIVRGLPYRWTTCINLKVTKLIRTIKIDMALDFVVD